MSSSDLPEGDSPSHLAAAEWLAVIVIMGFLTMLTVISLLAPSDADDLALGMPHHLKPQYYEVLIQGAVASPGSYQVPTDARVKDVVALADPLPEANIQALKATSKVRNGQVINVPIKEMLQIKISGAVAAGQSAKVKVPRGTRLNELGKYIAYDEEADIAKMDRKRYLRNSEEIDVPYKRKAR